jgi:hypothetical protein
LGANWARARTVVLGAVGGPGGDAADQNGRTRRSATNAAHRHPHPYQLVHALTHAQANTHMSVFVCVCVRVCLSLSPSPPLSLTHTHTHARTHAHNTRTCEIALTDRNQAVPHSRARRGRLWPQGLPAVASHHANGESLCIARIANAGFRGLNKHGRPTSPVRAWPLPPSL